MLPSFKKLSSYVPSPSYHPNVSAPFLMSSILPSTFFLSSFSMFSTTQSPTLSGVPLEMLRALWSS